MPPSYRIKATANNCQEQRQAVHQHLTVPTQNAGFRVPKTVLWLIKH
jgi:hypothetical protein